MKKIVITVTNDLETDQRMHKTALNLIENGFSVLLLGRKLPVSKPLDRKYQTKRLRLIFKRGVLFYAWYNIRVFLFLILHKWDIVLSCDMDTLPAGWLAHKIRRKKLVFDSHELFSEVPEIQNKKSVKRFWQRLETFFLPRVKYSYTVCQSIANYYGEKYGINMRVIRNVPLSFIELPSFDALKMKERFILYQGALNQGRGIEKMISCMQYIDEVILVIAGDGPLTDELNQKVVDLSLKSKVIFTGRLEFNELRFLTRQASVGLSLEEDLGLNYRFALPNKIFDYMQASVPSVVSALPEMEKVMNETHAGILIDPDCSDRQLAATILNLMSDETLYNSIKESCEKAAKIYNWENESKRQLEIFRAVAEFPKVN